jgi:hypothetical protein
MQIKKIQQKSLALILALTCVFAINEISDAQFVDNTAPFTNNTPTPIYTLQDQIKGDGSSCTGSGTTCGISVNAFTAEQNASFNQQTFFSDVMVGADTATSTLYIGGTDPSGILRSVDVNVKGSLKSTDLLSSDTLINSGSGELCAAQNGDIILCQ